MPRHRAVAIILHDNQLLVMFRRKNGREYYTLPGGGIEQDETSEQAVIREIKEETTLDVTIDRQIYEHHYDDGTKQYFFLCRYAAGDPRMPETAPERRYGADNYYELQWWPIEKLATPLLYPLEIRDWIIADAPTHFPADVRVASLKQSELRQQ